tara:strand:+ start:264 stop:587 length:324 start_codon:yes stop_codon:yes gene_type:complete
MAEVCIVCNEEITDGEEHRSGEAWMHYACTPEFLNNPEKYDDKGFGEPTPEELKKAELIENRTGSVITKINLPWNNVFWVSFQFLVVGLILAIPVWILFMVLLATAS